MSKANHAPITSDAASPSRRAVIGAGVAALTLTAATPAAAVPAAPLTPIGKLAVELASVHAEWMRIGEEYDRAYDRFLELAPAMPTEILETSWPWELGMMRGLLTHKNWRCGQQYIPAASWQTVLDNPTNFCRWPGHPHTLNSLVSLAQERLRIAENFIAEEEAADIASGRTTWSDLCDEWGDRHMELEKTILKTEPETIADLVIIAKIALEPHRDVDDGSCDWGLDELNAAIGHLAERIGRS